MVLIFSVFDITQEGVHDLLQLLVGWDCPENTCEWITRVLLWLVLLGLAMVPLTKFVFKPIKKRKDYFKNHIDNCFAEYSSKKSRRYYIDAYFQNIEPNQYPDIMDSIRSVSTENMIKKYTRDIFTEKNDGSPLYCVLGGSGMGKTSFLINVMESYVKTKLYPENLPFNINLINLANESYEDGIKAIKNPNNTILLLDALDENSQATADYNSFIGNLEKLIEPFRMVVVTCRTQFFPDEEHELKESKLINYGKKKGFYAYTRHYISPFSDKDVNKYLRKRYSLNIRKRKAAHNIVNQCASFTHRPLLLSYVDDLLTENVKYDTPLRVYEVLIDKWLERETSRQKEPADIKAKLNRFLQVAAVKMHENFHQTGCCVNNDEVDKIIDDLGLSKSDYQFKGRSLLNRDAQGLWKFSHKSFLEFFLAKEKFENEDFSLDFSGLSDAENLYKDFCDRELKKHVEIGKTKLKKSIEFMTTPDTICLLHGSGFALRYVEPFSNISILEIEARDLSKVENSITNTRISYVKLLNYEEKYNINGVLRCEQVKYISINGKDDCSKSFMKEARKKGIALLVKGELYNYDSEKDKDAPIDFKSVHFSNSPITDFGVIFNLEKQ